MAHGAPGEPGADPAEPASHTINTLRGSIGTHLYAGEWRAIENALEDYGNMTAKKAKAPLLAALKQIQCLPGNLPDEALTDRTGPNDARQRGLMITEARRIARAAIGAAS